MALDERGARIRRIQEVVSVREVAKSLGMAITKRGSSFLTICPFHSDTSPSLTLYDEAGGNNHFHCYSCGAHGDVFALVQQVRGVDFLGAAEWLATKYGLASPTAGQDLEKEKGTVNARLHGLDLALKIFKSSSDEALLAEFLGLRQISKRIAGHAEIMAIRGGSLAKEIQRLKEVGENWREVQGYLEETGLLRSYATNWSTSDSYRLDVNAGLRDFYYDDRILFPIRNVSGGLIGFAGRKVDWLADRKPDDTPKYMYSPKLAKAETLYRANLQFSRDAIAQATSNSSNQLVVVEGLLDAIRAESLSLTAVAILGALASSDQESLITKYAE